MTLDSSCAGFPPSPARRKPQAPGAALSGIQYLPALNSAFLVSSFDPTGTWQVDQVFLERPIRQWVLSFFLALCFTVLLHVDPQPGDYAWIAEVPDPASHGMLKTFTIAE